MTINLISLDLIAFELFAIMALLAYIAWQVTPKKGGKNECNDK